jgi:hypothetical protein
MAAKHKRRLKVSYWVVNEDACLTRLGWIAECQFSR